VRHVEVFEPLDRAIRRDSNRPLRAQVAGGETMVGAHIENNMVVIPDFGRLFFGELLISRYERRLTMVRGALGSDSGGDSSAGDVQDNGSWGY